MKGKTTLFGALALSVAMMMAAPASARKVKELTTASLGIAADGRTLCTDQLQQAIDRLGAKGGGVLRLTAGTYLTGSLTMRSGVELQLDRGATLLGSPLPEHYQSLVASEAKDNSTLALLVADGLTDIAVTGSGCIDGNGRQLALAIDSALNAGHSERQQRRPPEPMRPKLFFFSGCEGLRVEGLQLRSSACWGLSLHGCRHVTIEDVDIENRAYWNNDGIDLTDCRDATIRRCDINSADDGICLKSYDPQSACEHILIEDCSVRSSASAVKFGTASWGGFRDVTVRRIRVRDTFRSAIALECVDGGRLEDILVDGIHATNTGNPIFVRLGHRAGDSVGVARRITIRNVFVEMAFGIPDIDYDLRGPGFSVTNPRPSSITGIPGHPVEDVLIENVELVYPGRASKGIFYQPLSQIHQVPEQEARYPEFSMFGELPAWGFYVRHACGVSFSRVRLSLKDADYRPAFVFDDARGLRLADVSLPLMGSGQPYYARESQFDANCLE